ncbi:MAG: hypothetical protein LIO85_06960 [Rikenellaceae bacterium]|nr:hypothetical protein [Rikenellaceae bacterium]
MRKYFLILFFFSALLSSCIREGDIRILEVEDLRFESLSTPVVTLSVQNKSGKNIKIRSGRFTVSTSAGRIAELILTGPVDIRKRSVTSVTLPIRMRITNPLAAAPLLSGGTINTDRIFISGETRVKAGAAKIDFAFEDTPLSRLISIFDR